MDTTQKHSCNEIAANRYTLTRHLLYGFLLLLIPFSSAWAGPFDRLIMPGPLITGHAKYTNACHQCHDTFNKSSQRSLCLACHKKVAQDITNLLGFHGKNQRSLKIECRHCHTDHKGADYDIVLLDQDTFNHDETDFPLQDNHLRPTCTACHKPDQKYRDAPKKCSACHKVHDVHRGNLGEACEACHKPGTWKEYTYDHDKTKYPLKGAHKQVACAACHPDERWKKISQKCISCHGVNDIHNGIFGNQCEKCHTPDPPIEGNIIAQKPKTFWQYNLYDHNKSRFKLTNRHLKVKCIRCHTEKITPPSPQKKKEPVPCIKCHRKDDGHKNQYGEQCDICHTSKAWKGTQYDHSQTKFPLEDGHLTVPCSKCHTGKLFEQKLGVDCYSCHRVDDVHKGRYGKKCETCHQPTRWKKHIFNHDKTKFPLQGKHIETPCDYCHPGIIAEEHLGLNCYSCHRQLDVHKTQLGNACEKCHNPQGWRVNVFFDHDLTPFPLIGLHAITPCESCHLEAAYKNSPKKCHECHMASDVHKKGLGEQCGKCHNPNSWKLWQFDHNTQTKYKLDGAHLDLACLLCHKEPLNEKNKPPQACNGCHMSDDVHRGKLGRVCKRCHLTESFKKISVGR